MFALHLLREALRATRGRSLTLSAILEAGRENLHEAPEYCQNLLEEYRCEGCFLLPFMDGSEPSVSFLEILVTRFRDHRSCWFAYSAKGILLVGLDGGFRFVTRSQIERINFNIVTGSEIRISVRMPIKERLRFQFGEPSTAPKLVGYLNQLLGLPPDSSLAAGYDKKPLVAAADRSTGRRKKLVWGLSILLVGLCAMFAMSTSRVEGQTCVRCLATASMTERQLMGLSLIKSVTPQSEPNKSEVLSLGRGPCQHVFLGDLMRPLGKGGDAVLRYRRARSELMSAFYGAARRIGENRCLVEALDAINRVFPEQTLFPVVGFDLEGLLHRMDEVEQSLCLTESPEDWSQILESGGSRFVTVPLILNDTAGLTSKLDSGFPEVRLAATERLKAIQSPAGNR